MSADTAGLRACATSEAVKTLPLIGMLMATVATATLVAIGPETLRSVNAVPAFIAGRFREPAGFEQAASGEYFVFDRRGHTVFGVDAAQSAAWEIVQIGAEPGRIIDPTAFSVAPDGSFVVADAPRGQERIQIFSAAGQRTGGFNLRSRTRPRVMLDNFVMNGIGSLRYTGSSILLSDPDSGGLMTEYRLDDGANRTFGALRATGHEDDRDVHLAMNSGIPLRDIDGGYVFVFQAGAPAFRKYDASGALVFERRIEGREIDAFVNELPTTWPARKTDDGVIPIVRPTIRTAALDAAGNLWISFVVPYTYVFDRDGDKIRVVQFQAAGIVAPNGLFFGRDGHLLVTPGLFEFDPTR